MKSTWEKLQAAMKDRARRLAGLDLKAEYITTFPCAQNALDIFTKEWNAQLPHPLHELKARNSPAFEDPRSPGSESNSITPQVCARSRVWSARGQANLHARETRSTSILSIGTNTHAFLRCLVLKELLGLNRSRFMLGDFVSYLRTSERYDLVIASGVLYHLVNPVETIALMSKGKRSALRLVSLSRWEDTRSASSVGASFSRKLSGVKYSFRSTTIRFPDVV